MTIHFTINNTKIFIGFFFHTNGYTNKIEQPGQGKEDGPNGSWPTFKVFSGFIELYLLFLFCFVNTSVFFPNVCRMDIFQQTSLKIILYPRMHAILNLYLECYYYRYFMEKN